MRRRRHLVKRDLIAVGLTPIASSCSRVTTPCWERASRATAASIRTSTAISQKSAQRPFRRAAVWCHSSHFADRRGGVLALFCVLAVVATHAGQYPAAISPHQPPH